MLCFLFFILTKSSVYYLAPENGTDPGINETGIVITSLDEINMTDINDSIIEIWVKSENVTGFTVNLTRYINFSLFINSYQTIPINLIGYDTASNIHSSVSISNATIFSKLPNFYLLSDYITLKNVNFVKNKTLAIDCNTLITDTLSIVNFSSIHINKTFNLTLKDYMNDLNIDVYVANETNSIIRDISGSIDIRTDKLFSKISKSKALQINIYGLTHLEVHSPLVTNEINSINHRLAENFTNPCDIYIYQPSSIYIYGLSKSQMVFMENTTLNHIYTYANTQINCINSYSHTAIHAYKYTSIIPFSIETQTYVYLNEVSITESTVSFDDKVNITIGKLDLFNESYIISDNQNSRLYVENMSVTGFNYNKSITTKILITITGTLLVDHVNATFNALNFRDNSFCHIRYYFDDTILKITDTIISSSTQPLFILEFVGTEMPTDAQFKPYKDKIHFFANLPLTAPAYLKYTHVDDDIGVIGFTKSTDITQPISLNEDNRTSFGFKFMDYPTRVYPHFCYAAPSTTEDICGKYAFMFPNISGRSMSDYITTYTISVTVSLYENMIPGDVFNFDSARKPRKIYVIGRQNETMLQFNMVFTSETHTSVRILDASNVKLNFQTHGIASINIPKVYLHNVEVVNRTLSMADIDQLVVDIKTLSRLKSEGLQTFYVNIDSTHAIIFKNDGIWDFIDTLGESNTFKKLELMKPVLAATRKASVEIRKESDTFMMLPFTFLSESDPKMRTLEINVTGDWPLKSAIDLRMMNSVVINTQSSNVPVRVAGSLPIAINAADNLNKLNILNMTLPDKSDVSFTFNKEDLDVDFIGLTAVGSLSFAAVGLNRQAKLNKFVLGEISVVSLTNIKVYGNMTVPFMARVTLIDSDVSSCDMHLFVKLEEGGSRVIVVSDLQLVEPPQSIFVNVSLDPTSYYLITPTYYIKSVTLISSSTKVLAKWRGLANLSSTDLVSPATPIIVSLDESDSLIIAQFKGYAPDMDDTGLKTIHIALIAAGAVIIAALLGYGGMTLYLKCRQKKDAMTEEDLPNDNGVELPIL